MIRQPGGLGLAACCAILTGCSTPPPDVYAVPVAVAYEKLRAGSLKDFRYARQCGILIDITSEGVPDKSVRWVVTSSGLNVASWTARLEAVDADHTRITIEVPPGKDGKGEIYDGTQFYPRPALHQPLRPAVRELIESRLEERAFDVSRSPNGGENESVCNVQRGGLQSGAFKFGVDDIPSMDTESSERTRAMQERDEEAENARYGEATN